MRSKFKRQKAAYKPLSGMFDTVKPSSKYPATYAGFPADMDDWNCGHFKDYYLKNKQIIGKDAALRLIEIDADRVGTWASSRLCHYDCEFIDFFKKEGLTGGSIFSKLYCAGESAADTVGNLVGGAEGLSKSLKNLFSGKIGLLGLGLVGYAGYRFLRNGKKE